MTSLVTLFVLNLEGKERGYNESGIKYECFRCLYERR